MEIKFLNSLLPVVFISLSAIQWVFLYFLPEIDLIFIEIMLFYMSQHNISIKNYIFYHPFNPSLSLYTSI